VKSDASITEMALPEGSVVVPVISLWQPWASWVAWGLKLIETRKHSRFSSLVGQRIGIHAANRWDHDALKVAQKYLGESDIKRTIALGYEPSKGILCTTFVWAHKVCENSDAPNTLIECETRRYGLFLEAIHKIIPPFRCKGRQGIWREICPSSVHGSYTRGVSKPNPSSSSVAPESEQKEKENLGK
jgi:hypothetical protein